MRNERSLKNWKDEDWITQFGVPKNVLQHLDGETTPVWKEIIYYVTQQGYYNNTVWNPNTPSPWYSGVTTDDNLLVYYFSWTKWTMPAHYTVADLMSLPPGLIATGRIDGTEWVQRFYNHFLPLWTNPVDNASIKLKRKLAATLISALPDVFGNSSLSYGGATVKLKAKLITPCTTCGKTGHKSKGCLVLRCRFCGGLNHTKNDCPSLRDLKNTCMYCGGQHHNNLCTSPLRALYNTKCYGCGNYGHLRSTCPELRQNGNVMSFVNKPNFRKDKKIDLKQLANLLMKAMPNKKNKRKHNK